MYSSALSTTLISWRSFASVLPSVSINLPVDRNAFHVARRVLDNLSNQPNEFHLLGVLRLGSETLIVPGRLTQPVDGFLNHVERLVDCLGGNLASSAGFGSFLLPAPRKDFSRCSLS